MYFVFDVVVAAAVAAAVVDYDDDDVHDEAEAADGIAAAYPLDGVV